MKNKLITKKDIILLTALLLAALLVFFVSGIKKPKGNLLVITQDGSEIIRERLTKEEEIRVETADGGYNIISIVKTEDGSFAIKCSESNCPEKICIDKGLVILADDPIVCLPHRMTAKIIKEN